MLEEHSWEDFQAHLQSGRIRWREDPWTYGVYKNMGNGDVTKRSKVAEGQKYQRGKSMVWASLPCPFSHVLCLLQATEWSPLFISSFKAWAASSAVSAPSVAFLILSASLNLPSLARFEAFKATLKAGFFATPFHKVVLVVVFLEPFGKALAGFPIFTALS